MQKVIGSACLVAGTAIGAGMIALPLCLAKLGIIASCGLMIIVWLVMYYSSLVNIELNLKAGKGMPLGRLGALYSGRVASVLGNGMLLLLSYSLISAYMYGGAEILQKLIIVILDKEFSFTQIAVGYTLLLGIVLGLGIGWVDYINRILFIFMLGTCAVLIGYLVTKMNFNNLPLYTNGTIVYADSWTKAIPVIFTSFGFQVIFHSLTNYCNRDAVVLKKAFFYGSLIPMVIYIVWTCSVLGVIHDSNPEFYNRMIYGGVEVGDFILILSNDPKLHNVQLLTWIISVLAIVTSATGVGLGLVDAIKANSRTLKVLLAIAPPFVIALFVPNAFIQALSFAGLVLVFIAILLPLYLLGCIKDKKWTYGILKFSFVKFAVVAFGLVVIVCEVINLIYTKSHF